MSAPERIAVNWTKAGKAVVGVPALHGPAFNVASQYIRADLSPDPALFAELVEAAGKVLRNTDEDGIGTVLIVDLLHLRAVLAKIGGAK